MTCHLPVYKQASNHQQNCLFAFNSLRAVPADCRGEVLANSQWPCCSRTEPVHRPCMHEDSGSKVQSRLGACNLPTACNLSAAGLPSSELACLGPPGAALSPTRLVTGSSPVGGFPVEFDRPGALPGGPAIRAGGALGSTRPLLGEALGLAARLMADWCATAASETAARG